MAAHLWQSTLFAVAAGLLSLAFRDNRAKVRFGLWLSASVKFLVPFSLLISVGSHFTWVPVAATPAVSYVVEQIAEPFSGPSVHPAAAGVNWTGIAIGGLWAVGFAAIVLMRVRSWLRIRAALDASTPLDIPCEIEIRSSAGLLEPSVAGWSSPVLLLPEGIRGQLTELQLAAVLAHEICHVRRRDNLWAAVHMLVEALFWFHPLVWWIGGRLVEERERACDEGVLNLGSEPQVYADAIVGVCKLYVESPMVCVSGVTGANLKQRIEAIMMNRTGRGLGFAKKFLLVGSGMAALSGPVAIGVLIHVGNVPAILAQPIAVVVPMMAQIAQEPLQQVQHAKLAAAVSDGKRKLVPMLFDFGMMTTEQQTGARQSAINFVQNKMGPTDTVAILVVNDGRVSVVQDFTENQTVLETTIQNLSGDGGGLSDVARLSNIGSALMLLTGMPQQKMLLYYSVGTKLPGQDDQGTLRDTIEAAKRANVAIYPVGARGLGAPQAGESVRLAYAREKFPDSQVKIRTYVRYGEPDQMELRGTAQIWKYKYLENFGSNVEFQFSQVNGHLTVHINWPPPRSVFQGTAGADAGTPMSERAVEGLPGGHATMQVYPAEEFQTLSAPLDSMSGQVEFFGQIRVLSDTGAMKPIAFVRDNLQASAGPATANFDLRAGSYVCSFVVKEQASGKIYGETIHFEVK